MLRNIFVVSSVLIMYSASSMCDEVDNEDANFKDGIYVNNHIKHPDKSFWAYLGIRFFGDEQWPEYEESTPLIPKVEIDLDSLKTAKQQLTWLGHSTFLIQVGQLNILTDPVFSERASPVSFAGPKRYTKVATDINSLPDIDIVIISHNHYDHLDEVSIQTLGNKPLYFVPSGLSSWFVSKGIDRTRVIELRWWQNYSEKLANYDDFNFELTAMPSQHWSARGVHDRHQTHWASWLISVKGTNIWYAGDTGYNDKDFVDIGGWLTHRNLSLDLALIPIGAYAPRDFMKAYHVNTEEAVQIHKDIGSKLSIGMHWGAFPLTSEPPMEPFEWLNKLRAENQLGKYPFETMKIGETREY